MQPSATQHKPPSTAQATIHIHSSARATRDACPIARQPPACPPDVVQDVAMHHSHALPHDRKVNAWLGQRAIHVKYNAFNYTPAPCRQHGRRRHWSASRRCRQQAGRAPRPSACAASCGDRSPGQVAMACAAAGLLNEGRPDARADTARMPLYTVLASKWTMRWVGGM